MIKSETSFSPASAVDGLIRIRVRSVFINQKSFKKAEEMHRKKQTTSTYLEDYGYLQKLLKP
jgi:hypothetical protein